MLYEPLLCPICAMSSACLSPFDLIFGIMFAEEYELWRFLLCNFLHYPLIYSFLGPIIFLNTLFPNTLILCSSHNLMYQVLHSYKQQAKLYACMF
jgi:hypothetical protein